MLAVDEALAGLSENEEQRKRSALPESALTGTRLRTTQKGQLVKGSLSGDVNQFPQAPPDTVIYTRFPGDYSAVANQPVFKPMESSAGNLALVGDVQVNNPHNAYPWVTDGAYWYPIVGFPPMSSSGVITYSCPFEITGDCDNAFSVSTASGIKDFRVNTNARFVQVGAQSQLIIGSAAPGDLPFAGAGFFYNHQGHFAVQETYSGSYPVFMEGQGQLIFCDTTALYPAFPNIVGVPYAATFRGPVGFVGGFAWDRITFTTAIILNTAGKVTYAGYTGSTTPGIVNVTLPPSVTSFGVAGSKPGAVVIIKDEVNLITQNNHALRVAGAGGQLIDGSAAKFLGDRGAMFLISTGTGWQQFQ